MTQISVCVSVSICGGHVVQPPSEREEEIWDCFITIQHAKDAKVIGSQSLGVCVWVWVCLWVCVSKRLFKLLSLLLNLYLNASDSHCQQWSILQLSSSMTLDPKDMILFLTRKKNIDWSVWSIVSVICWSVCFLGNVKSTMIFDSLVFPSYANVYYYTQLKHF